MNAARRAKLIAIGELHDQWVTKNLESAGAAFDSSGRKEGSDYNLHHVDLDADGKARDEFVAAAMKILNGGH